MGVSTFITDVDAAHDDISSELAVKERKSSTFLAIGIFAVCALLTFILACTVKEDLRRVNYKQEQDRTGDFTSAEMTSINNLH